MAPKPAERKTQEDTELFLFKTNDATWEKPTVPYFSDRLVLRCFEELIVAETNQAVCFFCGKIGRLIPVLHKTIFCRLEFLEQIAATLPPRTIQVKLGMEP